MDMKAWRGCSGYVHAPGQDNGRWSCTKIIKIPIKQRMNISPDYPNVSAALLLSLLLPPSNSAFLGSRRVSLAIVAASVSDVNGVSPSISNGVVHGFLLSFQIDLTPKSLFSSTRTTRVSFVFHSSLSLSVGIWRFTSVAAACFTACVISLLLDLVTRPYLGSHCLSASVASIKSPLLSRLAPDYYRHSNQVTNTATSNKHVRGDNTSFTAQAGLWLHGGSSSIRSRWRRPACRSYHQ